MKQYIIFDLEATCWEGSKKNNQINEIIEIGAVKLNEDSSVIDTFQTFVKPTKNPLLSEFCSKLTSIRQVDVDNAPYFSEAMYNFERWIYSDNMESSLISWGYYDKNQIIKESEIKNYHGDILNLLNRHYSLKHDFAKMRSIKPCGMAAALKILGITLDGTHHRAIDDALNISKIFEAVFEEWKRAK